MANSIEEAQNYAPLLDKKYKKDSLTANLEVQDEFTQKFDDAGTVQIMDVVTDGLGDYDREAGFSRGSTTAKWEPYTITHDRSQEFQIDAMDNAEAKNMVFVETARTFMSDEVIPEVDATRFATMAQSGANIFTADLADGDAALAAWDVANEKMDDEEVPEDGRIGYLSNAVYTQLKNAGKITRGFDVDQNGDKVIDRRFRYLDGIRVIKVPKSRFYTEITLDDGTGGGGYEKTAVTGQDINFQIVHPSAVKAITRHQKVRVFSADTNQTADADKYQYRIYHDLIVPANKTQGVYTHAKVAV